MPNLTFLEADRPLVKSYRLDSEDQLVKESYPQVWEFTSHTTPVTTLWEFHQHLVASAKRGWCLLKGELQRALKSESRAGATDSNTLTWFICFDFDRLGSIKTIEDALAQLGLQNVSYIVQYSASHGVEPEKGCTAHVFIMLSAPAHPASLKQWLIGLNLKTAALNAALQLTRTHNALSWALDVSTCQNDKLIYIAPPNLADGVPNAFQGERIQLVDKKYPLLDVGSLDIPTVEANRTAIDTRLDALRAAQGLPKRKWQYKIDKTTGLEVLAKPDATTLSNLKRERGFVYFNLNGGDSWGYYHPEESPNVIRNFKGEPSYLTSELLPEYWAEVQRTQHVAQSTAAEERKIQKQEIQQPTFAVDKITTLVFRDFKSALYYNGTWDPSTQHLALARAASETQIQHYLKERGLPEIDYIPVWNLIFDPHSDVRVDAEAKTINTFEASRFMLQPRTPLADYRESCPNIARLIQHAVARDPQIEEHFLNWFACIFTLRTRCMTTWVLHGIQGTGKGLLVNHVLIPLLGYQNCVVKRMAELDDQFNEYMEGTLLMIIDEAQISAMRSSKIVMANLKNMITEPQISVRKMRTAAYEVRNYCNFMLLSNQPDPIQIEDSDRRTNVGEFQPARIKPSDSELQAITAELEHFANYLFTRKADTEAARTALESSDRTTMMATSTNSIDATAQALLTGDLEFFWDALPAGEMGVLSPEAQSLFDVYTKLVHNALKNPTQRLARDELRVLFAYNVGDVPRTPAKFTSMLQHHRVHLKPIRIEGKLARGLEINWKMEPEWTAERLKEIQTQHPALRAA